MTRKDCNSRYYQNHKEELLAKQKEKKAWKKYYDLHKEEISEKRKERRRKLQAEKKLVVVMTSVAELLEDSPGLAVPEPADRLMTLGSIPDPARC